MPRPRRCRLRSQVKKTTTNSMKAQKKARKKANAKLSKADAAVAAAGSIC